LEIKIIKNSKSSMKLLIVKKAKTNINSIIINNAKLKIRLLKNILLKKTYI